MNIRDYKRDMYIYTERQKGRTYAGIARELGVLPGRIQQIYFRVSADIRRSWYSECPPCEEYQQFLDSFKDHQI